MNHNQKALRASPRLQNPLNLLLLHQNTHSDRQSYNIQRLSKFNFTLVELSIKVARYL